jgi:hypothetical protein
MPGSTPCAKSAAWCLGAPAPVLWIPAASIFKVGYLGEKWTATMLTPRTCASESSIWRKLFAIDWVESAVLRSDWHDDCELAR